RRRTCVPRSTRWPPPPRPPRRRGATEAFARGWPSEHLRRGKVEDESFVAFRQLDAQRRRNRPVEAEAEPEVGLHAVEIQIAAARGHFAGVVEEGHFEEAVHRGAPLPLQQQAVEIA